MKLLLHHSFIHSAHDGDSFPLQAVGVYFDTVKSGNSVKLFELLDSNADVMSLLNAKNAVRLLGEGRVAVDTTDCCIRSNDTSDELLIPPPIAAPGCCQAGKTALQLSAELGNAASLQVLYDMLQVVTAKSMAR